MAERTHVQNYLAVVATSSISGAVLSETCGHGSSPETQRPATLLPFRPPFQTHLSQTAIPFPCIDTVMRLVCSAVTLGLSCAVIAALEIQLVTTPADPAAPEPFFNTAPGVSQAPSFPPSLGTDMTLATAAVGRAASAGGGPAGSAAMQQQAATGGGRTEPGGSGRTAIALVLDRLLDVQMLLAAGLGGLVAWILDLALMAALVRLRWALWKVGRPAGGVGGLRYLPVCGLRMEWAAHSIPVAVCRCVCVCVTLHYAPEGPLRPGSALASPLRRGR
jgi:hypothetical protein